MSGADIFLYVGAGAGWGLLIGGAAKTLKERAQRADFRRVLSIVDPIYPQLLPEALRGKVRFSDLYAEASAKIDIADLELLDRYPYGCGCRDLVAPRLDEVRAWRAKRRRQPLRRLAAFLRSAANG